MIAMDIRGLILIETGRVSDDSALSSFAPAPWALLDVAGASPLARMAERLHLQGISPSMAIIEAGADQPALASSSQIVHRKVPSGHLWRAAEDAFHDLVQNGAELVVIIRLGAYAEINFEALAQFHIEGRRRVSRAVHGEQLLEIFCVSASRRNDAASLLRSQLLRCRSECEVFEHRGYINALANSRDFRQFGIDVLSLKTETRPAGEEIRPGIWTGSQAVIEKGARVLAPAFVGSFARIRTGVLVTRCSTIEHHAEVDCGTVVENSSVLPYSYIGAGLDVAHSVAGLGCISNLRRNAVVEIHDKKLMGQVPSAIGRKLLSATATLSPKILRRLLGFASPQPSTLDGELRQSLPSGEAAGFPAASRDTKAEEFAPNLAVVARRYGNQ